MMHLRVISAADLTESVVEMLQTHPAVANLIVHPGAARSPVGDVIIGDVAREAVSEVIDLLRATGVETTGAIALDEVAVSLSPDADRAEAAAPGRGSDAVVWQQIEQTTGEESRLTATFLVFLAIATIIAGIGVLLDQPILIVGAMVVGPEFGPLAALCVGLVQRRGALVRRSLVALGVGFLVAIGITMAATALLDAAGLVDKSMLLAERPLTSFIWRPDALSWVVGFLAGVAGMLSLTTAKSGALIGVLISVTTVPAAANAAVAFTYGVADEALGSLLQLSINLASIVVAGVLTLLVQRLVARMRGRTRLRSRPPGTATSPNRGRG